MVKTAAQVSPAKLRGGFYSPPGLVRLCLDRIMQLSGGRDSLRILEPSAGDGAFIRGVAGHPLRDQLGELIAVELVPAEAGQCARTMAERRVAGRVETGSFLRHRVGLAGEFDVAVGNPPFLRFQFVEPADRIGAEVLTRDLGTKLHGVSNLWIPIFLGALSTLRDGGSFAFIVPAECLTGTSGRIVRNWLIEHGQELRIDLFPVGSFPGVLQEVLILSGRIRHEAHGDGKIEVHDHASAEVWRQLADESASTWTGLLLRPEQLDAVCYARSLPGVLPLGRIAKLNVATVTGANEFFAFDDERRQRFQLQRWTRPLLARTRQAPGLVFTAADFERNLAGGLPSWLLDANLPGEDVTSTGSGARYVASGEQRGLPDGYKCRIRQPWYQVPVVKPGTLMLSKRSHRYPRLIRNEAGVVSTDTIYQGCVLAEHAGREADVVGSFHNSLTMLSAELYGRSFGGGVLELVPSEVSALLLPLARIGGHGLARLDTLVRAIGHDDEALIVATDALLTTVLPQLDLELMASLRAGRAVLLNRRLARAC